MSASIFHAVPTFAVVILAAAALFVLYARIKYGASLKDIVVPRKEDAQQFGTRLTRYMVKNVEKDAIRAAKGAREVFDSLDPARNLMHEAMVASFDGLAAPAFNDAAKEILSCWHINSAHQIKMTSSFVTKLVFDSAIQKLKDSNVPNIDLFKHRVYLLVASLVSQYDFPYSSTEDFIELSM